MQFVWSKKQNFIFHFSFKIFFPHPLMLSTAYVWLLDWNKIKLVFLSSIHYANSPFLTMDIFLHLLSIDRFDNWIHGLIQAWLGSSTCFQSLLTFIRALSMKLVNRIINLIILIIQFAIRVFNLFRRDYNIIVGKLE